jgi:Ion transport protein
MAIIVLLFINCVCMAAYRPMDAESTRLNHFLSVVEGCATALFTAEVLLKLASAGSFRKYFSSSWNLFDFVLVAAGFTKFLPFGKSTSAIKVLALLSRCSKCGLFAKILLSFASAQHLTYYDGSKTWVRIVVLL